MKYLFRGFWFMTRYLFFLLSYTAIQLVYIIIHFTFWKVSLMAYYKGQFNANDKWQYDSRESW